MVYKKILDNNINNFIIGRGTNILPSDKEFKGIVISLKYLNQYKILNDNEIYISSGCTFKTLLELTKQNIGGFEELACIPGSIGGLIYQNASYKGISVNDKIISVQCIDNHGNVVCLKKDALKFEYRSSIFKNKNYIILGGIFSYNLNGDINKIYNYLKDKKRFQPLNCKNAGSTFKNKKDLPAWKIIQIIGADKFRIGDAAVSNKHCNFLVNLNNSTFEDMNQLIQKIINTSKLYGYDLEFEIING